MMVMVMMMMLVLRVGSIPETPPFGVEFLVSIGGVLCLFHDLSERDRK